MALQATAITAKLPSNPSIVGTGDPKGPSFDGYKSFADWYSAHNEHGLNPDGVAAKIYDWFSGDISKLRDSYNQWYNEQSAARKAQSDYEYTRLLNQTKYADEVKALRDAGLNPYTILAGNGFSAGNMSYAASEAPMKAAKKEQQASSKGAFGALAIIIAALIKAMI